MIRIGTIGHGRGLQSALVQSILQRIGADQTQLIEPTKEVKDTTHEIQVFVHDPDDWVHDPDVLSKFQWIMPHDPVEYIQFPLVLLVVLVFSTQTAWLWWFYTLW